MLLSPENFLFINNRPDKVIICEDIEVLDNNKKIKVRGISLDGLTLRRIILPHLSDNFVRMSNMQASEIMYGFVERQCITPHDAYRKMENLEISRIPGAGIRTNWRATFDTKLSECLYQIGVFSGLGYQITADLNTEKLIFKVLEGRNLSTEQRVNPPVIFSLDYDNLLESSYKQENGSAKNAVYAVSGNLEQNLHMVHVSRNTAVSGISLKEECLKLNAGSFEELELESRRYLEALNPKSSISANIKDTASFAYEKDFDLGDIVTVVHKSAKKIMHERITKITEVYEQGHVRLLATFGLEGNSFSQRIENIERKVRF